MTSVAPSTAAGSAMETVPGSDPATSGTEANVQFSGHTQDKATKAKVHLESYYSNLLTQFQVRFFPAIYQYVLFHPKFLHQGGYQECFDLGKTDIFAGAEAAPEAP